MQSVFVWGEAGQTRYSRKDTQKPIFVDIDLLNISIYRRKHLLRQLSDKLNQKLECVEMHLMHCMIAFRKETKWLYTDIGSDSALVWYRKLLNIIYVSISDGEEFCSEHLMLFSWAIVQWPLMTTYVYHLFLSSNQATPDNSVFIWPSLESGTCMYEAKI